MRFHLVRHGQTGWNVQRRIQGQLDSDLNETGVAQAIERGKDFVDMDITAAYCSTSVRTRQTIANLLDLDQQPVTYMDELREVHFGIWQGLMWGDLETQQPDMVDAYRKARPEFNIEGAETQQQTQARGVAAMESLMTQHQSASPQDNIVLVSHGAIMKMILGHYAGISVTELHKLPPLPNCAHCIIDVQGNQRSVTHVDSEAIEQTPWGDYLK